ncbi:MAG: two-component regulator propeller domain-containing protein [Exilispira sp.]
MDKDDILWVGTYSGLCKFDIKSEKFYNYINDINDINSLSNDVVIAIERDKEGRLWIGTLKGLQIFDEKNEKFKRFIFDDIKDGPTKDSTIRDILTDDKGNVWIGTYDGIYKYSDGRFTFYTVDDRLNLPGKSFEANYPASKVAMKIAMDNEKNLWFGLWGYGLAKYDFKKNVFINYPLPFNKIYSLLFIDDENLLVGTWGQGLYVFNKKDNSFELVENTKIGLKIPNNTIYSLFKDKSQNIWIGTHGAGIIKWNINKPDLIYLKYEKNNPNSIFNSKVKTIFEDRYGYIWLGFYNDGLIRYNPQNKEIIKYISSGKDDGNLSDNIVRSIFQDSHGNLWIATNKYLNLYDYEKNKFKYFKKSDFGINQTNEDTFTSITEDKNKNLIIGTYLSGIIIVPLSDNKNDILNFSAVKLINSNTNPSLSNDMVFDILIDSRENIWIGTNKGLNLLDMKKWEIKKFFYDLENSNGICDNNITSIFEDSNGKIYVGTSNGLNIYDYDKNNFRHLTTKNGLRENYINAIEELEKGIILFTTFHDLVKYNTNTDELLIFGYEEEQLASEFSSGIVRLKDGSILLGGAGQINILKNQQLNISNIYNPDIQITSFKINGKEYNESRLYYYDLNYIKLPYGKNSISISFVSLDYSNPNSLLYSYKIDRINKDWQYLGNEGSINLANLKPATYKIYLRGTNSYGLYSKNIKTVEIKINPPFYLKWWVIILFCIIIFSIIFLIILYLREKALLAILIERKKLMDEKKIFRRRNKETKRNRN